MDFANKVSTNKVSNDQVSTKVVTKDGIKELKEIQLSNKNLNDKFIYHEREYIICFDRSIFHKSTFLTMLNEYEEYDQINDNVRVALGNSTIIINNFDADIFCEMIYLILYDASKNKGDKLERIASMTNDPMKFLSIHHALFKLLISHYGFDDSFKNILVKSFHEFLGKQKSYAHIFYGYFGTLFSKHEHGYDIKHNDLNLPYVLEEARSNWVRKNTDVKYIRACFIDLPFKISQHFLMNTDISDPILSVYNNYIIVEMKYVNKSANFVCDFLKLVLGDDVEYDYEYFPCYVAIDESSDSPVKRRGSPQFLSENNWRSSSQEDLRSPSQDGLNCISTDNIPDDVPFNKCFCEKIISLEKSMTKKSDKWDFQIVKNKNGKYDIQCKGYFSRYFLTETLNLNIGEDDVVLMDASRMIENDQ